MKTNKRIWNKWFAWYPVQMENDKYIWLRMILRKQITIMMESSRGYIYEADGYIYTESIFDILRK